MSFLLDPTPKDQLDSKASPEIVRPAFPQEERQQGQGRDDDSRSLVSGLSSGLLGLKLRSLIAGLGFRIWHALGLGWVP